MQGVTTAIVAFIFACVVWPQLVRHRPQFHAGLVLVVLIILLDAVAYVAAASDAMRALCYGMIALLQVGAILTLFFSAGGVTPRELLGGVKGAFEVIRRGEEEKEIIIPLSGHAPAGPPPGEPARSRRDDQDEQRIVYEINDPASQDADTPAQAAPAQAAPPDAGNSAKADSPAGGSAEPSRRDPGGPIPLD